MKLTVLGWQGPVPGAGGACSGYLLESDGGEALLMDLGPGALSRLVSHRAPDTLSAILVSHLHWDHISDLLPMRYAFTHMVDLYAPDGPQAARAALEGPPYDMKPHTDFVCGPFSVRFFPVRHPVAASAVRVVCDGKTLVYTGDTNVCPGLAEFSADADLLIADAGLCEADWSMEKPHLSPRLCAELARDAGAKKLLLTHLAAKNDPDSLLSEALPAFNGAACARDGLCIPV